MRAWRRVPGERTQLPGAIGVRPVDAVTGSRPIGRLSSSLDLRQGTEWTPAGARVVIGPSGVITCPRLERSAHPSAAPRRYRIRVDAELYRALYRATADGIEFDAFQYNDATPPPTFASMATEAVLTPLPGYPFSAEIRVLYGVVTDAAGSPVADALVTDGAAERAVTDDGGNFALPLRTAADGVPVAVAADHPRTGRSGSVTLTLPGDLRHSQTIQVA